MRPPFVGIDLIEPARLRRMLERNSTVRDDLFRPGELAYAEAQHDPIMHLAARFAAKEAVVKALGIDGWDPLDIEVTGGGEETDLVLHGEVHRRAAELSAEVTISMSHVEVMAAAVAIARPVGDA